MVESNVHSISAVTLAVADMARSVDFYGGDVGLQMLYGGSSASFTSFKIGVIFHLICNKHFNLLTHHFK